MRPLLSVVVPTHDTRDLTLRCLESVRAQGQEVLEVVVVDDGSSDGTAEALRALDPALRILRRTPAGGFSSAANWGLSEARGDLLLLLNSDTEIHPGALATLVQAFEVRPRLGAAGAELVFPGGAPQWSGGRAPTPLWLFALASGLPGLLEGIPGYRRWRPLEAGARRDIEWVSGAAMTLRRQAWRECGPFDEAFRCYCQDLDLCLRLRDAGWQVAVPAGVRVTHHAGATIGRLPGAVGKRYHPELLWTDLARWAAKRGGPEAARRAVRALRLGASLRLAARGLAVPFLQASRREGWRRESLCFREALATLGDRQGARADPLP